LVLFLNGVSFVAVIPGVAGDADSEDRDEDAARLALANFLEGFRFAMKDLPIRSALLLLQRDELVRMQYSVFWRVARDFLHMMRRDLDC